MVLQILKIIALVGTMATGLFALIRPQAVRGFTGLYPEGGRGISEVRSVLGGLFIGLGAAPLVLAAAAAYRVVGIGYLAIAAVRGVSMFVDKAVIRSSIISLVVEIVFGVILIL